MKDLADSSSENWQELWLLMAQLRGYQIHQGITALLAWHYRTGGDVSRYFGTWDPPNRNPKPRT